MTREEAIAELKFFKGHTFINTEEAIDMAIKELEKEPKWIPVSERLPEKNMYCLVSVGQLYLTQIAMYSDLMGIINHKIFHQGNCGYEDFKDITEYVKAWMPLPEEYKPESGVIE